jgi:hypothetical protein
MAQPERFEVDPLSGSIRYGGKMLGMDELQWDTPTRGAVYGVLMNYRGALEALKTVGGGHLSHPARLSFSSSRQIPGLPTATRYRSPET